MKRSASVKRYKTSPCKDCGFRRLGCHSSCKPYIDFQEYLAKVFPCEEDPESEEWENDACVKALRAWNKRNGRN